MLNSFCLPFFFCPQSFMLTYTNHTSQQSFSAHKVWKSPIHGLSLHLLGTSSLPVTVPRSQDVQRDSTALPSKSRAGGREAIALSAADGPRSRLGNCSGSIGPDACHPGFPLHCLAYTASPERQLHDLMALSSKRHLNWSAYLILEDALRSSNSSGQILPQTPICTS